MFLSFSEISLFANLQINPLRPSPSHSATHCQSFQFSVKIFSWSDLAGGPKNVFSPGSELVLGGPEHYYIIFKRKQKGNNQTDAQMNKRKQTSKHL
jgi:hypothetical protein